MNAASLHVYNCAFGIYFAIAFGEVDPPSVDLGAAGSVIIFFTFSVKA
jgi:hypothetical protein